MEDVSESSQAFSARILAVFINFNLLHMPKHGLQSSFKIQASFREVVVRAKNFRYELRRKEMKRKK